MINFQKFINMIISTLKHQFFNFFLIYLLLTLHKNTSFIEIF